VSNVIYLKHTIITAYDGALGGCSVCGTWEAEMPTDCPGHLLDEDTRQMIMDDALDYRRSSGGWTNLGQVEYRKRKRELL
jgi:hypothetical protein